MIMNEDFVTYDLAVKLKEKGFKDLCLAFYTNNNDLYFNYSHKAGAKYSDCYLSHNLMPKDSVSGKFVDAPTISQVLKWLRKKMEIFVEVSPAYNEITFYASVYKAKDAKYIRCYISKLKYASYK